MGMLHCWEQYPIGENLPRCYRTANHDADQRGQYRLHRGAAKVGVGLLPLRTSLKLQNMNSLRLKDSERANILFAFFVAGSARLWFISGCALSTVCVAA